MAPTVPVPVPIPPGPGQESVWDYPRPPAVEPVGEAVRVEFAGRVVAASTRALRVLETSHPPTVYIPPDDVDLSLLAETARTSGCEWKGRAVYLDLVADGRRVPDAAWRYPAPTERFADLKGYVAFYPGRTDGCWIGDERVEPQPGGFYAGWITSRVVGPFKGEPGTWGW